MSTDNYEITGYTKEEDTENRRYVRRKRHVQNTQELDEQIMNIVNANRNQLTAGIRSSEESVISIGATCVAEINNRFFLLVEIEIEVLGQEIEEVIIFRITAAQAAALLAAGIEQCRIVTEIPTPRPGFEVNLICAFVVGNDAFLVFDVENSTDQLVLVRVPLCTII